MRSCKSSENIWAMLIALEYTARTDVISTFMTAVSSGFGRFSKMGTAAVPAGKKKKTKTPPPTHITPAMVPTHPHPLRGDAPL